MTEDTVNQLTADVATLRSDSHHVRATLEKLECVPVRMMEMKGEMSMLANKLDSHICADARVDKLLPKVEQLEEDQLKLSGVWAVIGIAGGIVAFAISTAVAVIAIFN